MMGDFQWDRSVPFARAKHETLKANRALKDYVALGPGRSFSKLFKIYTETSQENGNPPTRCLRTLKHWSSFYKWQARIGDWEELNRVGEEAEWKERQRQIRQQDWSHAQRLRELADKILEAAPAFVKRRERLERGEPDAKGNRVDTKIVTVALDGHLLTKLEKLASDLGRLAAEVQPPVQEVDVKSGGQPISIREVIVELSPIKEPGA